LGDPLEWRLEFGPFADPQEIPGAFAGPPGEEQAYDAALQPGVAVFTHPTDGTRKTFRLDGKRLLVRVESSRPVAARLPLALLDRDAYLPGWYARYRAGDLGDPSSLRWELNGGAALVLEAQDARLSLTSFAESLPYLAASEDPDFGYPPGHLVPFPLAIVEVESEGSFTLEFYLED
jgi:hypothetical protein